MQTTHRTPLDRRVGALAARQHGVITRAQLVEIGLGRTGIDSRLRAGHLYRMHRGVYVVGRPALTMKGRFIAAVFAYGDHAALSHRGAAVLWGLQPERGPRIDITVPAAGGRRNRRTVIVHASRLREHETTPKSGIPVTTQARTIIDLADISTPRELERTLDEADYLRLDLAALRPIPGRRGAGRLARVLAEHEAGSTRTLSEFEERLVALCSSSGLPMPRINQHVEGYLADFVWPTARLIVETDGWRAHGTRGAFERDRRRDAVLTEAGWRVVRITWKRLENEPGAVAAQLRRLLAASV